MARTSEHFAIACHQVVRSDAARPDKCSHLGDRDVRNVVKIMIEHRPSRMMFVFSNAVDHQIHVQLAITGRDLLQIS